MPQPLDPAHGVHPPLLIRRALPPDAKGIACVQVETWRAAYEHLIPPHALASASEARRTEIWKGILAGASVTLVAEERGRTIGFASFGPNRDPDHAAEETGELYAIYVEPTRWGTGVGWKLWTAARAGLETQGFAQVTLWVLEGNERARQFYESVGFHPDAAPPKVVVFLGHSVPEVRYALRL